MTFRLSVRKKYNVVNVYHLIDEHILNKYFVHQFVGQATKDADFKRK